MKYRVLLFFLASLFAAPLQAQEENPPNEDPAHAELRALRDALLDSIEKDFQASLSYLHENVVVTYQNAETKRGHEGVKEYFDRMMVGEDRIVESIEHELTVDELSILYGDDTAVAFGDLNQHYKLTDGREFDLHSRWTATAVRDEGRWVVAAVHMSANLFDNPLLTLAKKALYIVGVVALAIGLALGVIGTIVVTKLRTKNV